MNEESLFAAALEKSGTADRRAFLDAACGGDVGLRDRVERLLAADGRSRGILEQGPGTTALLAVCQPAPPLAADQPFAGRFHLRRKLGAGGMGEVWVADQTDPVRRQVALKVIRPGLDSARLLARFEAERQALALMDHPNIAKVLDAGVADDGEAGGPLAERGRPYFVMELIDGAPITAYCDQAGLSLSQRLELFIPVCRAVQHAHQKGIIHRDLKPSNILVATYDGRPVPKVIDFGIAKATGPRLGDYSAATEVGALIGTLEYMPPEQVEPNSRDVDTRTDVYALGVVLYELLTGDVPFPRRQLQAAPFAEMLRIIREVEPPRPSARLAETRTAEFGPAGPRPALRVPRLYELDWIVMKCLEKDRARRYESASALAADVQRYLADEPVLAGPPSATYRVRKFVRRHRGPALAAGLVLLALVGGVVGTTIGLVQAERDKQTAERRLAQVETGAEVIGAIFDDLDPAAEEKEGRPLRAILGERLDRAAAELDGEAVGDPLVVARLQDRLGRTYLGLGHAAKAEALFAKAHATRHAQLGADHPLTLASASILARAYHAAGKRSEAIALFEEVRDAQVKVLGADDPDTLTTLSDLAESYWLADKVPEAVALFEQVRDERVRQLGENDDRTLATLSRLAGAYMTAERFPEAMALAEKVYEVRVRKHGADHVLAIVALNGWASTYRAGAKMRQALALFEQARDAAAAKLGPDHPLTLTILNNLAGLYRAFGRVPEAIALAEKVREARIMTLGVRHPSTLSTLYNLALAYRADGKPEKALPLLQQAAAGVEDLRFMHTDADIIIFNLCVCHEQLRQYDQAEVWWRKWLAVVKKKDGPESAAYAAELQQLGSNLVRQNKHADAEPVLGKCLAVLQKTQPASWTASRRQLSLGSLSWVTSHTQALLGAALLGQGKYADAEPLLVQGYEGMSQVAKGQAHPHQHHGLSTDGPMTDTLDRLVRLYDALDRPAEAAKYRKELEARRPKTAGPKE